MGAFHLPELAGQSDAVAQRIPILRISTIQPDPSYVVCTKKMGFSENFKKKLLFHLANDRSNRPVLTLGKCP